MRCTSLFHAKFSSKPLFLQTILYGVPERRCHVDCGFKLVGDNPAWESMHIWNSLSPKSSMPSLLFIYHENTTGLPHSQKQILNYCSYYRKNLKMAIFITSCSSDASSFPKFFYCGVTSATTFFTDVKRLRNRMRNIHFHQRLNAHLIKNTYLEVAFR